MRSSTQKKSVSNRVSFKSLSIYHVFANETVGVKSVDLPGRHAWVSQIVLFDITKHVR